MLKFQKNVPIKQTYNYLANFPRFSLIEKLPPKFYQTSNEASIAVAQIIRDAIKAKNAKGQNFVLGLATGSTPLAVYKELIRMFKEGEVSFKKVITFNLDEYYGIKKQDPNSYNHYMNVQLFNHIDIPKENINIPDGTITRNQIIDYCANYEKKIKDIGGIDIQILGIGRTGHIAFNEPPSPINSTTRLVYLHRLTRKDASGSFGGLQNVPKSAITMGIDTIKKAKKIIVMAWGQSKAEIVKRTIEGEQSKNIPSTVLQSHSDCTIILDKAAGEKLTRFNTPWTIRGDAEDPVVPFTSYWVLKCVTWLAQSVKKPILRLSYDDYEEYNLSNLIAECAHGSVEDLNLYVYKKIISRITGWPLGNRPKDYDQFDKASIAKKTITPEKVLIFSPHPDDDVISMGGTIKKLHDQGHQVHVAYMTSGSNAVFDHEAKKYLYFLKDFTNEYFWKQSKFADSGKFISEYNKVISQSEQLLENEKDDQRDTEFIRQIKRFIRSSEAKISINVFGLKSTQAYCLNLPFYRKGHLSKGSVTNNDAEIVKSLLRLVQPTVIYAAGDLTDPHGTHRKCLQLILSLYDQEQVEAKSNPKFKRLFPSAQNIFLYRGAWQEWSIPMSRIIVPLSPKDVEQKLAAILKHQSQKDSPKYPGDDKRQFWVRVKERNRDTAEQLNRLGFSDYEACECFVNLLDLRNYDEM